MISRSPRETGPAQPSTPSLFDLLNESTGKKKEPEKTGFIGTLEQLETHIRTLWAAMPWQKMASTTVILALISGVSALYIWRDTVLEHTTVFVARSTGAVVQRIVVSGAAYTGKEDLQAALQLNKGDSLVGFDAASARTRIEQLPWVRLASVDRQLPDTVNVTVYEHLPLARLIENNTVWVINKDGTRIIADTTNRFPTLPLVEGEGAAEAAGSLFGILGGWPALVTQLREAVYVSKRRWDLKFISGITVQLPEETPTYSPRTALPLLAKLEESRHVLTLTSGTVDLRLPDRIVLRLPDAVGATPVTTKPPLAD